jgi:hypothetical protein
MKSPAIRLDFFVVQFISLKGVSYAQLELRLARYAV